MLCVVAFLLSASGLPLFAQHPLYYTLDDENGLPSNEIYEVIQDRFGLIWFGCNSGLYSYDGFRTREYSNPRQQGRSILRVFSDNNGIIWSQNGNNQVFKIEADSLVWVNRQTQEFPPRKIAFDPDGGFFTASEKMIQQFDSDGHEITRWEYPAEFGTNPSIAEIVPHLDNLIVWPGKTGIWELNRSNGKFHRIREVLPEESGGFRAIGDTLFIFTVYQSANRMELLAYDGIRLTSIFSRKFPGIFERWFRINSAGNGNLWMCTSVGALRLVRNGENWNQDATWFPGFEISSALPDREGMTWFSSLRGGIHVVSSPEFVKTGFTGPGTNLGYSAIATLHDGTILAGSVAGTLYRISTDGKSVVPAFDGLDRTTKYTVKKIRPLGDTVLVSRGSAVACRLESGKVSPLEIGSARDILLFHDRLYSVLPDRVNYYEVDKNWQNESDITELRNQGGRAIEKDPLGDELYIACNDGLFFMKNELEKEVILNGNPLVVNTMCVGTVGIWAGCQGDGLVFLSNGKAQNPSFHSKIKEKDIFTMCFQNDLLFFSTRSYLYRVDVNSGNVASFSGSSGFQPNSIQGMTVSGKNLWLATNRGIIMLPADYNSPSVSAPPIRIEKIFLDDSDITAGGGQVAIPPGSHNLRIVFQGISFRSRKNCSYRYRLSGHEENWTVAGGEINFVSYPGLPPGEFTFEVVAVNENGLQSLSPASIPIFVENPVYLRPWFIISTGLLLFFAAFGLFQIRLKVIRKRHILRQQLIESQLTALKARMNPHFIFNTLNSIQDLVITNDIRSTNLYLNRFSSLMRKVLDASGKKEVHLSDEIEMLEIYLELEQLRFGKAMTFSVECDINLDPGGVLIPPLIVQPFVENAVKHGLLHKNGEKKLNVRFAGGEFLHCTIEDNGVGRKKSAEIRARSGYSHASFSTEATSKRLEFIRSLYGSKVELTILDLEENGIAAGTRVEIKLPLMYP